jgi:hypothetical protein
VAGRLLLQGILLSQTSQQKDALQAKPCDKRHFNGSLLLVADNGHKSSHLASCF